MKSFRLPTVRVHSWGGLGSQLLALGVLLDLQKLYPQRNFELVIHSSGVTRRISELDHLAELVQINFIDDYAPSAEELSKEIFCSNRVIRSSVKSFLNATKCVISKESSSFRILPWSGSIRCHYGLVGISRDSISLISNYIPRDTETSMSPVDYILGVHYRVGDLVLEKSSSVINIDFIAGLASKLVLNYSLKHVKLLILSDSPSNSETIFSLKRFEYSWQTKETWETFGTLLTPHSVIGTNSKISLWVALFRWGLEIPGEVVLPQSLFQQFNRITKSSDTDNGLFKCTPY